MTAVVVVAIVLSAAALCFLHFRDARVIEHLLLAVLIFVAARVLIADDPGTGVSVVVSVVNIAAAGLLVARRWNSPPPV